MTPFTISAKALGSLALPNFCPHCFWLKQRLANKLPWQIFPGIFSSIDSYSKKITTSYFERHGCAPAWLRPFSEIVELIEPPHWSKFSILDESSGVTLRGVPDLVCRRADGALVIIDNKTTRFTKGQDELLPMYEVQLNAYAWIAERLGMGNVAALGLIYFEPPEPAEEVEFSARNNGFSMPFRATPVEVPKNLEMIPPLLARARLIHDLDEPPISREGCPDCGRVQTVIELLERSPAPRVLSRVHSRETRLKQHRIHSKHEEDHEKQEAR